MKNVLQRLPEELLDLHVSENSNIRNLGLVRLSVSLSFLHNASEYVDPDFDEFCKSEVTHIARRADRK